MSIFAPRQEFRPGQNPVMNTLSPSSFRSRFCRLSAALPALVLLLAGAGSLQAETRASNMWWLPECVTVGGHETDRLLYVIFWTTLVAFILTQVTYAVFIVKYRYRKGVKAVYSHGNNKLELIWTATPAMMFILLAVWSDRVWLQLRSQAPKESLTIDLVAYQFGFHVRNPGADDKLAKYSQAWMKTGENNFGTNQAEEDAAGRDDYQSENQVTLPVGRPVNFVLRSQDVIHAFYVPEFRMYQDIVPGMTIDWVWLTPEKPGHYALACNQLCGTGHYNMQAKIDVVPMEEYKEKVKELSKAAGQKYDEKKAKAAAAEAAASAPVVAATEAHP